MRRMHVCLARALAPVGLLAALLLSPAPASAAHIVVNGTPGKDEISFNGITGQITVNGQVTRTFHSHSNTVVINGDDGADNITITDGPGNSRYTVNPDLGLDIITFIDGPGNDRYEMDGRDPNGYAGVAWAIGGKHDRPWPERPVFGLVRSMTYQSTRKKFDAAAYIARVTEVSNR